CAITSGRGKAAVARNDRARAPAVEWGDGSMAMVSGRAAESGPLMRALGRAVVAEVMSEGDGRCPDTGIGPATG
ncbi:MAG: hypothetical protein JWR66_3755, partial [Modestobacter sp.]|nr:hypothetical protein [Modestobacter sp.]